MEWVGLFVCLLVGKMVDGSIRRGPSEWWAEGRDCYYAAGILRLLYSIGVCGFVVLPLVDLAFLGSTGQGSESDGRQSSVLAAWGIDRGVFHAGRASLPGVTLNDTMSSLVFGTGSPGSRARRAARSKAW